MRDVALACSKIIMAANSDHASPSPTPNSGSAQLHSKWGVDISQECRDLMSTLPTAKGWIEDRSYGYQGFWYADFILQATLNMQKHFEAHDFDILLVTPPKSGTTWLKALIYTVINRARFPPNTESHHPLVTTNPHDLVPFLELKLYLQSQAPDLSSTITSTPRLFATHVPLISLPESVKNSNCRIVYLCRDLKDTFVSFWHFSNKLRSASRGSLSLEDAVDMFCEGNSPYGPLWDHIHDYWKASLEKPEKILFLKFEELIEQPEDHLKRIAEFIGCPFSPEEEKAGLLEEIIKLCSFDSLAKLEVNKKGKLSTGQDNNAYFRKGQVGDWKNYLTPEMASRFDQIVEQRFEGSGLKIN